MNTNEFKLDHLNDINPKRLYEGLKFRCRIHDVIDSKGCFGLEVIYPDQDERKFQSLFKLFGLASKINEVPKKIYRKQRVSAFYKNHWHRAIVLSDCIKMVNGVYMVEVKFVDLGIKKDVVRFEHVKEIDEKFFNFPLKSIYCSISLDEELFAVLAENGVRDKVGEMHLELEAQKFFTRCIYDKILYAKVIALKPQQPIKIKLCLQTNRGIIDLLMYTLSKFDRQRYELLKFVHGKHKSNQSSVINDNNNNIDQNEEHQQVDQVEPSHHRQLLTQKALLTKANSPAPVEKPRAAVAALAQPNEYQNNAADLNTLLSSRRSRQQELENRQQQKEEQEHRSEERALESVEIEIMQQESSHIVTESESNNDMQGEEEENEEDEDESEAGFEDYDSESALFSHLEDFIAKNRIEASKFKGLDILPVCEKRQLPPKQLIQNSVSVSTTTTTQMQNYNYSNLHIESVHLSSQHNAIRQSINLNENQQSQQNQTPAASPQNPDLENMSRVQKIQYLFSHATPSPNNPRAAAGDNMSTAKLSQRRRAKKSYLPYLGGDNSTPVLDKTDKSPNGNDSAQAKPKKKLKCCPKLRLKWCKSKSKKNPPTVKYFYPEAVGSSSESDNLEEVEEEDYVHYQQINDLEIVEQVQESRVNNQNVGSNQKATGLVNNNNRKVQFHN